MESLKAAISRLGLGMTSPDLAQRLDEEDTLSSFRSEVLMPRSRHVPNCDPLLRPPEAESIYLSGQSLGLQPRGVKKALEEELHSWGRLGVHAHTTGERPTESSDLVAADLVAALVGAAPTEVCVMGTLTTNLHLLLLAFYRPTSTRFKILCEARPFPSDFYVFESQARLRGFAPHDAIVEIAPRPGESCLRNEDLVAAIAQHGSQLALVCLPGVQFYTGQLFDIAAVTAAARAAGAVAAWDLAHAIGNVPLELHAWEVDCAVWCHYKFVCAGPGAVAGAFVHAKHAGTIKPVLQGWWGHESSSRFAMTNRMVLVPGAQGFRLSCPAAVALSTVRVGAELLLRAGLPQLRAKSVRLTSYLELQLQQRLACHEGPVEIITPSDPQQRGAQLSLRFSTRSATSVHFELQRRGVSCDVREPGVIRVAPKPLYNSFQDVFLFVRALEEILLPEDVEV